ncbi:hypothetical protein K474DRAFT_1712566 [Panus rudis PR-1116 ss-1]|nr:hypothetical protein K474DRAFT_1712566 [Panus rudis PR-1116 ss-1]
MLKAEHPALLIPAHILPTLLPDRSLTVAELLRFPFPPSLPEKLGLYAGDMVSCIDPTTHDPKVICILPIPSRKLLAALKGIILEALSQGVQSVHYVHVGTLKLDTYLPLWVIAYWEEVQNLRPVRQQWAKAEEYLQKQARVVGLPGRAQAQDGGVTQAIYQILVPHSSNMIRSRSHSPLCNFTI